MGKYRLIDHHWRFNVEVRFLWIFWQDCGITFMAKSDAIKWIKEDKGIYINNPTITEY